MFRSLISYAEIGRLTVWHSDWTVCVVSKQAKSEGHCLIVPKRQFASWTEIPSQEASNLFKMASVTAAMLKKNLEGCLAVDLLISDKLASPSSHSHIQLIPRFSPEHVPKSDLKALAVFLRENARLELQDNLTVPAEHD